MALNPNIAVLLTDKFVQQVFKEILKNRSVRRKDIRVSIGGNESVQAPLAEGVIDAAVKTLKNAHLIQERRSPIEDFNTYYVTAAGLGAEQQLRRLERGFSAV